MFIADWQECMYFIPERQLSGSLLKAIVTH